MTAKVYGIPNCSSVKKAIASLKENQIEVVFHDFKKHGVPPQLLDEWIDAFGLDKVINRKGTTWRNTEHETEIYVNHMTSSIHQEVAVVPILEHEKITHYRISR